MRATISLLRNGFEEEAVTFGFPHERVFRQAARVRCGSHELTNSDVRAESALPSIVLQKSFCLTDHKFSGLYVRQSNNHLRDYIIL
jgi:hypothetical protein